MQVRTYERLVRRILAMPSKPAVILMQVWMGWHAGMDGMLSSRPSLLTAEIADWAAAALPYAQAYTALSTCIKVHQCVFACPERPCSALWLPWLPWRAACRCLRMAWRSFLAQTSGAPSTPPWRTCTAQWPSTMTPR